MEISVVIPSAGKWPRLVAGLRSLAAQHLPADVEWEVIIVLDGVAPPPHLHQAHPRLRLEQRFPARGRGAARNYGIRMARGSRVVLLDDDMVAAPGLLQAHLDQQRERPSLCHGPIRELPPLIYVRDLEPVTLVDGIPARAAGRIRSQAEPVIAALADFDRCFETFGRESALEAAGSRAWQEGRHSAAWIAFAGANLSAPRQWLLDMPFDERAGTRWGLEDLALALRWWLSGRPLSMARQATALHLTHPRAAWRDQLAASAEEIDFISGPIAALVVSFLRGESPLAEMEIALSRLARERRE